MINNQTIDWSHIILERWWCRNRSLWRNNLIWFSTFKKKLSSFISLQPLAPSHSHSSATRRNHQNLPALVIVIYVLVNEQRNQLFSAATVVLDSCPTIVYRTAVFYLVDTHYVSSGHPLHLLLSFIQFLLVNSAYLRLSLNSQSVISSFSQLFILSSTLGYNCHTAATVLLRSLTHSLFFIFPSISLSSFSASPLSYIFSESFLRLSHFLINRFHNPIIRQLSPDVMSTIFEFCLLDITDHQILLFSSYAAMKKKYGNLFTPWLLGAICSYWRDVAWSTPSPSSGLQYWFMIQANIICI